MSGSKFFLGCLIVDPRLRPSVVPALERYPYLQDGPSLTTIVHESPAPTQAKKCSASMPFRSKILAGEEGSCVVQESFLDPCILEKIRGDFSDDIFRAIGLCWNMKALKDTGRCCGEIVDGVLCKLQVGGHNGIPAIGKSCNGLSSTVALPFVECCRLLRAFNRKNASAYAALTPIVRAQLKARLPSIWLGSCQQKPAPVEGRFLNLRELLFAPFPLNDQVQLHVQRVEFGVTRKMPDHRDGGHGAFIMCIGAFSGRIVNFFDGTEEAPTLRTIVNCGSGHVYCAGALGAANQAEHCSYFIELLMVCVSFRNLSVRRLNVSSIWCF